MRLPFKQTGAAALVACVVALAPANDAYAGTPAGKKQYDLGSPVCEIDDAIRAAGKSALERELEHIDKTVREQGEKRVEEIDAAGESCFPDFGGGLSMKIPSIGDIFGGGLSGLFDKIKKMACNAVKDVIKSKVEEIDFEIADPYGIFGVKGGLNTDGGLTTETEDYDIGQVLTDEAKKKMNEGRKEVERKVQDLPMNKPRDKGIFGRGGEVKSNASGVADKIRDWELW